MLGLHTGVTQLLRAAGPGSVAGADVPQLASRLASQLANRDS